MINVPAGASHDPGSSGDGAPRLMQTIQNADLSLDAKFDSAVSAQFQEQGAIVEQDSTHYVYASIVQNSFETDFVVKTVSGAYGHDERELRDLQQAVDHRCESRAPGTAGRSATPTTDSAGPRPRP